MKFTKEMIDALRANPVAAARILLNVKLNWYQVIMLRTAWTVPNTIWLCCRGAAKTYVAAVFLVLKCLLYRKVKVGIVAGSGGQACETLRKIKDIYMDAPILQQETKGEPKIRQDDGEFHFKNGSWIEAFPLVGTKRGRRKDIIFEDEVREINQEAARPIINPMLNVKHPEVQSQILYASTACYEGQQYDLLVKQYKELQAKGNKDFAVCDFDYHDALTGGFLNQDRIEQDKQIMLPDEFAMEYENVFVSLRDGFITAPMIRGCEVEYQPEDVGDPTYEYMLGLDSARVFDNTSITVWKIIPGTGVRISKVIAMKDVPFPEQALLLRQTVKDFINVAKIRMDEDTAGRSIKDLCMIPMDDPRDGRPLPLLTTIDNYEASGALAIIEGIKFANQETIRGMALKLKGSIQNKTLQLPKDDYRIVLADDELIHLSIEEQSKIELFKEISEMKKELTTVKQVFSNNGMTFTFQTENRTKNKKDRFSSAILGASAALEYYDEITSIEDESYVGGWA